MGSVTRIDLTKTHVGTVTAHATATSAEALQIGGKEETLCVVGIGCPADVDDGADGANVTDVKPQVQLKGDTTWRNVYDKDGNQLTLNVANDAYVYIDPAILPRCEAIRLVVNHADGNDTSYKIVYAVV